MVAEAWGHLALILPSDGGPSAAWAPPLLQLLSPPSSPRNHNFGAGQGRTGGGLGERGWPLPVDRLNPSPLGAPLNLEIN